MGDVWTTEVVSQSAAANTRCLDTWSEGDSSDYPPASPLEPLSQADFSGTQVMLTLDGTKLLAHRCLRGQEVLSFYHGRDLKQEGG